MEFEKVRDIIVETLGCDAEQVTMDASLADDLGADSLASVELVMALEEATGISIDDSATLAETEDRRRRDDLPERPQAVMPNPCPAGGLAPTGGFTFH